MKELRFEWSTDKAKANIRIHGVSFEEAKTVFFDENAVEFDDQDHSFKENRYLMIGLSSRMRLLLVSYTFREEKDDDIIRIISSRKPTKKEQKVSFEKFI
jgi:uncharacterized DUF497 family protein